MAFEEPVGLSMNLVFGIFSWVCLDVAEKACHLLNSVEGERVLYRFTF